MRFADYVSLALRSLRRSRLRSALTIAAILVGATGITVMLTFVTSVKHYVISQFTDSGQDRQVQVAQTSDLSYRASGQVDGGGPGGGSGSAGQVVLGPTQEAAIAAISHVSGVAATSGSFGPGFEYLAFGGKQLSAQRLMGYEPNGVVRPSMVAGRSFGTADRSGVVLLSKDYATALGFGGDPARLVGQMVVLHTQAGYTGGGATLPNVLPPQRQCEQGQRNCFGGPTSGLPAIDIPARVIGIVSSEDQQGAIILPLPWLIDLSDQSQPKQVQYPQSFGNQPRPGQPAGEPVPRTGPPSGPGAVQGGWQRPAAAEFIAGSGGYGSFIVDVDDSANVPSVAATIDRLGLHTATGLAALAEQKHAADVIGLVLGALGLVALGIAALGITNTMVMSVLERTREIGVMRAVGARRSAIRRLFAFEAAMLGFFGGVIGVAIGYTITLVAAPLIRTAVKSGDIAGTSFSVPLWLVGVVVAGTTLIGFVSGLLPARRAARLDPIEALRYE
ncbi:MAG: hypothetical protein JWO77_3464 [Ilumatobacteraceae bacterium]|nr:hypothetical protein [Ilumatobacteraceae bacterium]